MSFDTEKNMAESQKFVTVNGQDYLLNAMPSSKGFPLLARLTKYAAPVIAELSKLQVQVDEKGNEIENSEADVDVGSILQNLFFEGTDGFVSLVQDLVKDVTKDGVVINMDREFKQNYMAMLELALEVIKFNFADVFQRLGIRFD